MVSQTVSEQQEQNILSDDIQELEKTLRGLWELVGGAAEVIQSLREENRALRSRVEALEQKNTLLEEQLRRRDHEVRLMQQQLHDIKRNGLAAIDEKERAELRKQIIGLIEKINSHL